MIYNENNMIEYVRQINWPYKYDIQLNLMYEFDLQIMIMTRMIDKVIFNTYFLRPFIYIAIEKFAP